MANKYWIGGSNGADDDVDGDFDVAANWLPAVAPAAADTLIFGDTAGICDNDATVKHTEGNHWNCLASSVASIAFQGIIITDGYTGKIGISDAEVPIEDPIPFALAGGKQFVCYGNSTYLWLVDNGDVAEVIFDSTTGVLKLSSDAAADSYDTILCRGAGTIYFEYRDAVGPRVDTITVIAGATTVVSIGQDCLDVGGNPVDLNIYGGTVYSESALGAVVNNGGTIHCGKVGSSVTADLDITSLAQQSGLFYWRAGGDLTTFTLSGGSIIVVGEYAKLIAGNPEMTGGTFDMGSARCAITITNDIDLIGGVIHPPKGAAVTW